MAKKSFQIVLNESAQRKIKSRASLLGENIGDYIEKISASLESRLRRAYEIASVDPAVHDLDDLFIKTILLADKGGLTEAELHREFEEIGGTGKDAEWTPEVKL